MIEISLRCGCGSNLILDLSAGDAAHRWMCNCPDCYGPVDDSGPKERIIGYGPDPESAIAACWEWIENEWEVGNEPNLLFASISEQAGDEADRQALWTYSSESKDGTPRWLAPAGAELAPIPLAWPRHEKPIIDLFEALNEALKKALEKPT